MSALVVPQGSRRERKREQTANHLAATAFRLFEAHGYDSVAMRDGMSLWTGDVNVIGAQSVACTIPERITAALNAPLNPGPSTAAT